MIKMNRNEVASLMASVKPLMKTSKFVLLSDTGRGTLQFRSEKSAIKEAATYKKNFVGFGNSQLVEIID